MRAGKLRHRITVYNHTKTQDHTGDIVTTWVEGIKLWASIEPLSVKDVLQAQAANSETTMRCVLRYRADINSKLRIKYRGVIYEIDGNPLPDPVSGIEYMTLMLKQLTHG